MTTQNSSIGGSTPDISGQEPTAVLAAAEKLRSEEVGKFLGVAARFIGRTFQTVRGAIGDEQRRRCGVGNAQCCWIVDCHEKRQCGRVIARDVHGPLEARRRAACRDLRA